MKKTAKGWGVPADVSIGRDNVDVHLCGVCTCKWRKEYCLPVKSCERLFSGGGLQGQIRALKALMGDDFPKDWGRMGLWRWSPAQAQARDDAIRRFKEDAFKRCRALRVEVRTERP